MMHSKVIDGVNIDEYSNILFDDIDIKKKWRAAVAIWRGDDVVSLMADSCKLKQQS